MKNSVADLMTNLEGYGQDGTWQKALKFFDEFGFHIINYGIMDKNNGEVLGFHSNMADNWMDYYMTSEYGHADPWARYVNNHDKPILYSRYGPSELIVDEGSIGEKMINEVADYDLNTSICVPVHNKFGHLITGFNLCSKLGHDEFQVMLDEHLDDILLGSALLNNVLVDTPMTCVTPSWSSNPFYKHLLSQREVEVLKWLSEGHRNDRIADQMNIASVTVNFHLKEIKRKLGAQTREQSIALAFKKGLLR